MIWFALLCFDFVRRMYNRSVYWWNAKIWLDANVVDMIEHPNISMLEWSGVGFGCLKMFSFWLHCGQIEYELNAKSNLINNIRFNSIYWMICAHTKPPTDMRLVYVCDVTTWSHEWCLGWFGLVLVCAIGHTIKRSCSTLHLAKSLKLMMMMMLVLSFVDAFQNCPVQNCHVVRINIGWSLRADLCFAFMLFKYHIMHPAHFSIVLHSACRNEYKRYSPKQFFFSFFFHVGAAKKYPNSSNRTQISEWKL